MKILLNLRLFLVMLIPGIVFVSCEKDHPPKIVPVKSGNLSIFFTHNCMGHQLVMDTLAYVTSTGDQYTIGSIQYFLSDFRIHVLKTGWLEVTTSKGIHYIDALDKSTWQWKLKDDFPAGSVDSVAFTFGLNATDNFSYRFPDPPERDMFWPDILGGGYHYMKLDLKWKNKDHPLLMPFMFHIGIGQMYQGNSTDPDSIVGFIQNYFSLKFPMKMVISPDKSSTLTIAMNIDRWFDGGFPFLFEDYPNGIMQDQSGMFRACMNGRKAFEVK